MIIPETFAQVNLRFTGGAVPLGAEMTFGVSHVGHGGTPAQVAGDIGADWITSNMNDQQVNDVTLSTILVKFGPNDSGNFAEVAVGAQGTDSDPGITPNTSVLIKKETNFGGRQGRGRMYMPGLPEHLVGDGGVLEPAYITSTQAACDAFFAALVADDLVPVLLHSEDSPPQLPYTITEFVVDNTAATQRRRMRR
jgi:hypothetical protein